MNLSHPLEAVTRALDGRLLEVLTPGDRLWTGRALAVRSALRLPVLGWALARLVDQGIVRRGLAAPAHLYGLNKEHLAARYIVGLAGLRAELIAGLRDQIAAWQVQPVVAVLFGSVARGEADAASDIDLLIIAPDDLTDDQGWTTSSHRYRRRPVDGPATTRGGWRSAKVSSRPVESRSLPRRWPMASSSPASFPDGVGQTGERPADSTLHRGDHAWAARESSRIRRGRSDHRRVAARCRRLAHAHASLNVHAGIAAADVICCIATVPTRTARVTTKLSPSSLGPRILATSRGRSAFSYRPRPGWAYGWEPTGRDSQRKIARAATRLLEAANERFALRDRR